MSTIKKEDIFSGMEELINMLDRDGKPCYTKKVRKIKDDVEKLLTQQEESLYYGIVNDSLKEDWDNEKDDAYNEL